MNPHLTVVSSLMISTLASGLTGPDLFFPLFLPTYEQNITNKSHLTSSHTHTTVNSKEDLSAG